MPVSAKTAVSGMVISTGWAVARLWPFADAAVKLAVPKSVSGSVRPAQLLLLMMFLPW